VVVNYFNVVSAVCFPTKADAPLTVDADAVLALPVALQRLQPIPLGNSQVIEIDSGVKVVQLEKSQALQVRMQSANPFTIENPYRQLSPETPYHCDIQPFNNYTLLRLAYSVNNYFTPGVKLLWEVAGWSRVWL
jgi:hypothetical protein